MGIVPLLEPAPHLQLLDHSQGPAPALRLAADQPANCRVAEMDWPFRM